MTVRVERTLRVDASPEDIWEFIADPAERARAISVVDRFDRRGETTIWHIDLPIPLVRRTLQVRTKDVERNPPTDVKFRGTSKAFTVTGKHTIAKADHSATVSNVFVVEGRAPGVERFFERNFEEEIGNLERALRRYLDEQ
ncbi:SRPBCC family protein [Halanaeroarchaeum sulfurireducens]|uniref:Polyketide cyclase/dehydrase n=1 Tax=Halanaeroarchaeum sulfurireducens TaxID=1604004 RepID=A0A0N9MWQ1_9EURY|nr:SRPBCC family protein [Halanaeroarchaeum sulfurireducens]ALG82051.1 polyketide cyclase/dehydrase [Halanaeroarchaeum sulfurireducens]